jgi:HEAT repeat protein
MLGYLRKLGMPSRKIEQQLESLGALGAAGTTETAIATVRKALKDPVNLVVAKAASTATILGARVLIPDLVTAFDRLLKKGAEGDPQCWGKKALAKALKDLGHDESPSFIRGLQHVQMEPVWGSHVDTAGTVRSTCVLALLQCADLTREDKLWHQTRALTDSEPDVRLEAARALEEMEGREAALLLRLKARMGDKEASVTGQVLASLLSMEGEGAVRFVAEFLGDREDGVHTEAALALGASRQPAAIQVLMEYWQTAKRVNGEAVLRGISASRQEASLDFLMKLVREAPERQGLAALDALALHRDSSEIRARVAEAVGTRRETSFKDQFRQRFPAR